MGDERWRINQRSKMIASHLSSSLIMAPSRKRILQGKPLVVAVIGWRGMSGVKGLCQPFLRPMRPNGCSEIEPNSRAMTGKMLQNMSHQEPTPPSHQRHRLSARTRLSPWRKGTDQSLQPLLMHLLGLCTLALIFSCVAQDQSLHFHHQHQQ